MKSLLVLAVLFITLENCTGHTRFQSPNFYGRDPIELADSSASCRLVAEIPEWFILYGIEPIDQASPLDLFPNPGRSYRIEVRYTWVDKLISMVMGFSLSISRRTVFVEDCGESLRHSNLIKGLNDKSVASLLEKTSAFLPNEVWDIVWLRDGSVWKGKVVQQSNSEILFMVNFQVIVEPSSNKPSITSQIATTPISIPMDQVLYVRYSSKP